MYKWLPVNLLLGVTLRWTSIPSRRGGGGGGGGPLGSYADFTYLLPYHVYIILKLENLIDYIFYAMSVAALMDHMPI